MTQSMAATTVLSVNGGARFSGRPLRESLLDKRTVVIPFETVPDAQDMGSKKHKKHKRERHEGEARGNTLCFRSVGVSRAASLIRGSFALLREFCVCNGGCNSVVELGLLIVRASMRLGSFDARVFFCAK